METYRVHYCRRKHRTALAFARCIWRKAAWVDGATQGTYATLAYCRVLTVELHDTLEQAERSKAIIDRSGCGGFCDRRHEMVRLEKP